MRRVPPSAQVREEIDRLLSGGVEHGGNIVSELASLGLRYLAQQALEQEQQDHLGRERYERRGDGEHRGWRNGYEDARMRTAEGAVPIRVPQVRSSPEPYRSRLIEFLAGNSEALEALVTEMYARGLSTRDVEDCFRGEDGELLISRTAVSEITDRLWEDYQAFCARDLSGIDASTCSWTPCTSRCAAAERRTGCSPPGASPRPGERSCWDWPWATRSPRHAGPRSCAT